MKRCAASSLIIILLLAFGCESPNRAPAGGYGDPYPAPLNDPQISVLSADLRPWLGFHPATTRLSRAW